MALFKLGVIDPLLPVVAEAKCGSSEGGNSVSEGSHHPERSGCVRSYKPTGHRHIAEMEQELGHRVHFSATSIEMVRGILVTAHLFVKEGITEKDIWKTYREVYGKEPFIRIVKEKQGIYRFPEPKSWQGPTTATSALNSKERDSWWSPPSDNLMKGAAGQAVHAMNVMAGFEETAGLSFAGFTRSDMCRLLAVRSLDAFSPAPYLESSLPSQKQHGVPGAWLGVCLVGSSRSVADLQEHPARVGG